MRANDHFGQYKKKIFAWAYNGDCTLQQRRQNAHQIPYRQPWSHPPSRRVPSISILRFCTIKERCWLNPLENSKSPQPWDRGFYLHCVRLNGSVQSFHLLSRSLKEDESCNSLNGNLLTSPIQSKGKGRTPLMLHSIEWLDTGLWPLPPFRTMDSFPRPHLLLSTFHIWWAALENYLTTGVRGILAMNSFVMQGSSCTLGLSG
jgi:hypothetical protein